MAHDPVKEIVTVERVIPAAPGLIFELLADPRQHHVFDGSGSVKEARISAPKRLSLGATFAMNMRVFLPYRITNTVVEFEENRRIAWRHFGGHIWRYILTPVEGGTLVTEQFDYAKNRSRLFLKFMNAIENNERWMDITLANIERHFSPAS
ncbi:MAG: dimethyladenosine transferase [Actinobacteria bacterium]|jgi:uncharacterized protein YndB with AHSA1/START domain|nr:dimethyladenosine transferase [Actinomycetota bacterium]NDF41305.1 dimethyladenosine transferase [Actinomycetota bacterium]NDI19128.1 dimethyladenosine transferase [Actinomycetota bacterium]